jgi:hypothetical protein
VATADAAGTISPDASALAGTSNTALSAKRKSVFTTHHPPRFKSRKAATSWGEYPTMVDAAQYAAVTRP